MKKGGFLKPYPIFTEISSQLLPQIYSLKGCL